MKKGYSDDNEINVQFPITVWRLKSPTILLYVQQVV